MYFAEVMFGAEQDRRDEQDDGAQCRRQMLIEPGDLFGRQANDEIRYKHHYRTH